MTVDDLLGRLSSRELTEWGLLFEIHAEERDAEDDGGEVGEHGELIDSPESFDDEDEEDDEDDDEWET